MDVDRRPPFLMRVYRNPKMAQWAVQEAQRIMGPARDWDEIHASDLTQCLRQSALNRKDPQPMSREEAVRFAVGYALQEYFFGSEDPSQEFDKVWYSSDGFYRELPDKSILAVLEFKSTGMYMATFDEESIRDRDGWLFRTAAYCAKHGTNTAHFMVYFLFQRDIDCFTVVFTDAELRAAEKRMDERRDILRRSFDSKGETLPSSDTRLYDLECTWCPYLVKYCPGRVAPTKALIAEQERQRKERTKAKAATRKKNA